MAPPMVARAAIAELPTYPPELGVGVGIGDGIGVGFGDGDFMSDSGAFASAAFGRSTPEAGK